MLQAIRFGARKTDEGWHLEVALPARKDQVEDAADVVRRVSNTTFQTEDDALEALAYVLTYLVDDPRHG